MNINITGRFGSEIACINGLPAEEVISESVIELKYIFMYLYTLPSRYSNSRLLTKALVMPLTHPRRVIIYETI